MSAPIKQSGAVPRPVPGGNGPVWAMLLFVLTALVGVGWWAFGRQQTPSTSSVNTPASAPAAPSPSATPS